MNPDMLSIESVRVALKNVVECRQPGMAQCYPSSFLNVFASFSPIFSHSAPPDSPIKSGSMPQVAWNLQLSIRPQNPGF